MAEDKGNGKSGNNREDGYDVGYGKPPVETQFKNGNSASVGHGRPRGTNITKLLGELREECKLQDKPVPKGRNLAEAVAEKMYRRALSGDFRYTQEILNRTEGKVPDRLIADIANHDADRSRSEYAGILAALRERAGVAGAAADHGNGQPGGPGGNGEPGPLGDGTAPGAPEPEAG